MANFQEYKNQGKKGLFDEQFTIERLSEIGNPLEKISNVIDFESFRSTIEAKLLNRNLLCYDINPNAIELTTQALDFENPPVNSDIPLIKGELKGDKDFMLDEL